MHMIPLAWVNLMFNDAYMHGTHDITYNSFLCVLFILTLWSFAALAIPSIFRPWVPVAACILPGQQKLYQCKKHHALATRPIKTFV